jgi:hypothetical protein
MRSEKQFFADIRHSIRDFYKPGDQLHLVRHYEVKEARKCEMCGGMVSIFECYDLRNNRTGEVIVCGRRCISRYADVVDQMDQIPSVIFPHEYRDKAQKINQRRQGTVIVEGEPDADYSEDVMGQRRGADKLTYEDALADGLNPDEIDWESHDYE